MKLLHMPGSVQMLETSLRDAHHPTKASLVLGSVVPFIMIMPLLVRTETPFTIQTFLSYASTLRKLLSIMLQPIMHQLQQPGRAQMETDATVLAYLPYLMFDLQRKLIDINAFKAAPLRTIAMHSTTTQPNDVDLTHVLSRARTKDLHQLGSVALAMLVQMCHCCRALEQAPGSGLSEPPQWLHQTISDLRGVDRGLGDVACTLLQGPVPSSMDAQMHVDSVWEQFAATHFNGRLVRGCCYLGCTNLDGVSEAALKTQLCSGCMKARYCSVGCQKAAWCKGGHKFVCCK